MTIFSKSVFAVVVISSVGCASQNGVRDEFTAESLSLCALCDKAIPDGKGVQAVVGDGESANTKSYRCIHCALTDLQHEENTITIEAITPLDRQPVRMTRSGGTWSSQPSTTVFLILPERADECLDLHQPFADRAEFDRYLDLHPEIQAEQPVAWTIEHYEEIVQAGVPRPE